MLLVVDPHLYPRSRSLGLLFTALRYKSHLFNQCQTRICQLLSSNNISTSHSASSLLTCLTWPIARTVETARSGINKKDNPRALRVHIYLYYEKQNSGVAVVWKFISEPARFASITARHSSAQCKHSVPPPWVGKVGRRKLAYDLKWKYSQGHSRGPTLNCALYRV